jgi:hypothetical protein
LWQAGGNVHGGGFQDRFRSKPESAAKAAFKTATRSEARVDRSAYWYVKLHLVHLDQLEEMNDPIMYVLFATLLRKSFAKGGKPFELPTDLLARVSGLKAEKRTRARLHKLAQRGLISITARPSKPPLIQVPLALGS